MGIPGIALSLHGDSLVGSDVVGVTSVQVLPVATGGIDLYDTASDAFAEQAFEVAAAVPLDATNYPALAAFDVFAALVSGSLFVGTGPAWTSTTARAAAIETYRGRLVNAVAITLRNGATTVSVPAREALLVGGFGTTLAGLTEDSRAKRLIWNAWWPVARSLFVHDITESWAWSSVAWRQVRGAASNQVEYMQGLVGRLLRARHVGLMTNSSAAFRIGNVGIGLDTPGNIISDVHMPASSSVVGAAAASIAFVHAQAPIGRHAVIMSESGAGADAQTWYGANDDWTKTGLVGDIEL